MTSGDNGFFSFLTPAQIYRQLTEGAGPRSLRDERIETDEEKSAEEERAELVRLLANTIRSGWQGEASSGAYGAAMPLADSMLNNAAKLNDSQDLLSRQLESFHAAFNSVRPVSAPPESSVDEKYPFDEDYEKAVTEYQDSAHHNIAVYREYDGASYYNETHLPQEYNSNTRPDGNVSVTAPVDTIEVGDPEPGSPRRDEPGEVGGGGEPRNFGDSSDSSDRGSSTGRFPTGPGAGPDGLQTNPSEFRPSSPAGSYPVPPSAYPPVGQPPSSPDSAAPGGFVGGVPVSGGYSGETGGGFGPRGGSAGGGVPSGGGPRVVAPGLGAGAGALAAEEAAARRAGQAAAGARPGGVGPMGTPVGTGRGKDDEDSEHQRKVLLESDAEDTFGGDVLTAPQVIGDDEYED